MTIQRRPDAEVVIDEDLVRALLHEQHEDLASLPLVEAGEGWDNKQFRLGDELVVRLPRRQVAAALIEHERRWLPVLAPRLPLPVPAPVRAGRPGSGYPWAWAIAPWFVGETAAVVPGGVTAGTAVQLGHFLAALHQPAPLDAPVNPFRTSLSARSDAVTQRLSGLGQVIETEPALDVWRAALDAPGWSGPPVWLHGDLHPGNLVVKDGHLTAVIDFGDLTAGDPAVDLAVAWMLWPPDTRVEFRRAVNRSPAWPVDDVLWRRARGWALSLGLAYLANSLDNPLMGAIGQRTIANVLADRKTQDPRN
jgi:aminoglycoside phosphotransferase (APT) family kinase protein